MGGVARLARRRKGDRLLSRASRGARSDSLLPVAFSGGCEKGAALRAAKEGDSLLPVPFSVGCERGAALCAAKETSLPRMGQGKGSHHQQFFSQAMRQWVRAMAAQACELTTRRRRSRWTARAVGRTARRVSDANPSLGIYVPSNPYTLWITEILLCRSA